MFDKVHAWLYTHWDSPPGLDNVSSFDKERGCKNEIKKGNENKKGKKIGC